MRELQEEMGVAITVKQLLYVVENRFTYEGRQYHELGLYYQMELPSDSTYLDPARTFMRQEGPYELIFRWFTKEAFASLKFYPPSLMQPLLNGNNELLHLVENQIPVLLCASSPEYDTGCQE